MTPPPRHGGHLRRTIMIPCAPVAAMCAAGLGACRATSPRPNLASRVVDILGMTYSAEREAAAPQVPPIFQRWELFAAGACGRLPFAGLSFAWSSVPFRFREQLTSAGTAGCHQSKGGLVPGQRKNGYAALRAGARSCNPR